jgi:hypothetical protein
LGGYCFDFVRDMALKGAQPLQISGGRDVVVPFKLSRIVFDLTQDRKDPVFTSLRAPLRGVTSRRLVPAPCAWDAARIKAIIRKCDRRLSRKPIAATGPTVSRDSTLNLFDSTL